MRPYYWLVFFKSSGNVLVVLSVSLDLAAQTENIHRTQVGICMVLE